MSEQNLSDKVDRDEKGPDYKNKGKICFTNGEDKTEHNKNSINMLVFVEKL